MNVHFLEPAEKELAKAKLDYEQQRPGLGEEFEQEVKDTIQRIADFPNAWTQLSPNTRRCRTKRFPYGVVYSVEENDLIIVAIMHLSRKPGYWKDRS
jgi:plasmid stabilization system protein ParE